MEQRGSNIIEIVSPPTVIKVNHANPLAMDNTVPRVEIAMHEAKLCYGLTIPSEVILYPRSGGTDEVMRIGRTEGLAAVESVCKGWRGWISIEEERPDKAGWRDEVLGVVM